MDKLFIIFEEIAVCIGIAWASIAGLVLASAQSATIPTELLAIVITGYGGGVLRDAALGKEPSFFTSYKCWIVSLSALAVKHLIFPQRKATIRSLLKSVQPLLSGVGTAGFLQLGLQVAVENGLDYTSSIIVAMLTNYGGGIIATILFSQHPLSDLRGGRIERILVFFCLLFYYPIFYFAVSAKKETVTFCIFTAICVQLYMLLQIQEHRCRASFGSSFLVASVCQFKSFSKQELKKILNPNRGYISFGFQHRYNGARHSIFLMP